MDHLAGHHRLIDCRNRACLAIKIIIDWVTTARLRIRQVYTARGITADEAWLAKGLVQRNNAHCLFLARLRGDWLLTLFALWRVKFMVTRNAKGSIVRVLGKRDAIQTALTIDALEAFGMIGFSSRS